MINLCNGCRNKQRNYDYEKLKNEVKEYKLNYMCFHYYTINKNLSCNNNINGKYRKVSLESGE